MGLRGLLELEATLDELDTLLLDFATELLDITTELLDFAELLDCTATEEHEFMFDELDGVCDELEDFAKLELDMGDDDEFMELLEITLEELVESAELEGLVLLDRFSVEDDDVVALEDDKLTELLEILLDELDCRGGRGNPLEMLQSRICLSRFRQIPSQKWISTGDRLVLRRRLR